MAALPKDEPVLVTSGVFAVASYVLAALVSHGVLTSVQASSLTQQIVPAVAALLPMVLGLVARARVTPNGKVPQQLEPATAELVSAPSPTRIEVTTGPAGLTDADFARLRAELGHDAEPPTLEAAPAAEAPPDGMSAG